MWVCVYAHAHMHVCVCVTEREKERGRERRDVRWDCEQWLKYIRCLSPHSWLLHILHSWFLIHILPLSLTFKSLSLAKLPSSRSITPVTQHQLLYSYFLWTLNFSEYGQCLLDHLLPSINSSEDWILTSAWNSFLKSKETLNIVCLISSRPPSDLTLVDCSTAFTLLVFLKCWLAFNPSFWSFFLSVLHFIYSVIHTFAHLF